MLLLAFPEYLQAGQRLASALGVHAAEVKIHHFPDGESRVTLPQAVPEHVVICRSLFNPNEKLVELMLTAKTARALGAGTITLVAPYLCYMRQDKAFTSGEAVSQQIIGEFLSNYVDNVITVDPHLHRVATLQQAVPASKAIACSSAPLLAEYIRQHMPDALLLGPDSESEQWLRAIATITGQQYLVASKQRAGDRSVKIVLPDHSYQNRDVVIVDDIISTGRTLATAVTQLRQHSAGNVSVLITHVLFSGDAEQYLYDSGVNNIHSTDSIPHPSNAIELAPLLAQAFETII